MQPIYISIFISICGFVGSILAGVWFLAVYKTRLELKVKDNQSNIQKQWQSFRFAQRLTEQKIDETLSYVIEIQNFLAKNTNNPRFQIRIRKAEKSSSNSGADFLKEWEQPNNDQP